MVGCSITNDVSELQGRHKLHLTGLGVSITRLAGASPQQCLQYQQVGSRAEGKGCDGEGAGPCQMPQRMLTFPWANEVEAPGHLLPYETQMKMRLISNRDPRDGDSEGKQQVVEGKGC